MSTKQVLRQGRRIVGFVWNDPALGWSYAFGRPSQSEFAAFSGNIPLTKEQAIARVLGKA